MKRYQKTILLSAREERRSPSPQLKAITYSNGSEDNDYESNDNQYNISYKSEVFTYAGKPYEKLIEIPVSKEVFQTTPPISSNTTVMSFKQVLGSERAVNLHLLHIMANVLIEF